MRTRLTSLPAALGAALLAVTLTSCSGDPEPIIEPAPSTSPSPSSAPPASPSATPTPDEPESAKAFIRRFQSAIQEMQVSGDSGPYRDLTYECSDCDALADEVDDIYGANGSIVSEEPVISGLRQVGESDGVRVFEFSLVAAPMTILASDGSVERDFAGGEAKYQMNVALRRGEWKALRISQLVS
jgi:hypothetical protein